MVHHSDNAVKPIIGNHDIEPPLEVGYKASTLKFDPLRPDEFQRIISETESERVLSDIYTAIVGNSSLSEIINTLSYFETVITNSNVANRLINSAFLVLFVHMLKNMKSHMIKTKVCSIVGLLIRHATVIDNDIAKSGIKELLI